MSDCVPYDKRRSSRFPRIGEVFILTMEHSDGRRAGLVWTTGLGCALYSTNSMASPTHVNWQEAQQLIWQARRERFRISQKQLEGTLPSNRS
jgi:hypothetical protein